MEDKLKGLLADFERQAAEAKESANLYSGITAATKEGQAIAYERAANQVSRLSKEMTSLADELEHAVNAPTWELALSHVHNAIAALQQLG